MTTDTMEETIAAIRAKAPRDGRLVYVSGDFNVIHPGHQRILNFAARCGDFLVVGVNADGLGKTLFPETVRCEGVAALNMVGHAFIQRQPAEKVILTLQPAIVVKGAEYKQRNNPEQAAVSSYGGRLLFSSGETTYSSLELLQHELQDTKLNAIELPVDYLQRHSIETSRLTDLISRFASLKVVVAGDLIVDEYIECSPLGMSREDPTLVVTPITSKRFIGGAGIVAAHARGLGASVNYISVVGNDEAAAFALERMEAYGLDHSLVREEWRPTTLKQRFRASNKTLLRVSHLVQTDITDETAEALATRIEDALDAADLLIFSDFNYGCLPQRLVDRISAFCRKRGIPYVADSQASSQLSDVSRYSGALLLTPTEHEARLAVHDAHSGLVVLAESLLRKADACHVMITLGAEGVLIHAPRHPLVTDKLGAFNTSPMDVSGAGDSLLTCTAMSLVAGGSIWESAYLGSVAAACQVSRIGNLPLVAKDILTELVS